MKFAVIAHGVSETNLGLVVRGWQGTRAYLLPPREALLALGPGDVALNRLDVAHDLSGIEDGNWIVNQLEAQGVRVFNRPSALLAAHDKLITARLLEAAGLPHPRTWRLDASSRLDGLSYPVIAKPRYGSWGRDVELCPDRAALERYIATAERSPWWPAGGIVQELVMPGAHDLRVIIAARDVVGAASRVPRAGEWRTNVALGATIVGTVPPPEARELAIAAVRALGIDVGGAVDVRPCYSLGREISDAVMTSLERDAARSLLIA
jgi:RimK family alpha-L-glutamate ligase